jgi:hypothetical protein
MATTTNYSWSTPDNTSYVKDGASSIRTLGSSVDTTLFTALGGAYPGLRLVKKQTIGSGVSTVSVTNAFSATYDNYKIIVSGGAANAANKQLAIQLGSTVTDYYYVLNYNGHSTPAGTAKGSNTSAWTYAGSGQTFGLTLGVDITSPFLSKISTFSGFYTDLTNTGTNSGYLNNSTSYTSFILSSDGTMTGGTIYVYGYGAS